MATQSKSKLSQTLNRLESFYNPERFAEIEALHTNAFSWQQQDRIPLGIHVINPQYSKDMDYRQVWLKPEVFLEIQTQQLADTLEVGSDLLPTIGINHLGDAVITSLFGARQYIPDDHFTNLGDIGPTPLSVFSDIMEVNRITTIDYESELINTVDSFARYYKEHLPDWVKLVGPMPTGPFSAAMQLRGSELLIDIMDHPNEVENLINLCTQSCIELERRFRRRTGSDPEKCFTNFGILSPGFRLGEDSICNISPNMIRRFCRPVIKQVNEAFPGQGHIHFCSLPHARFEHIYNALLELPEVAVASSQYAFEYYQRHLERLRQQLAIESFYGNAFDYVCKKYGSFLRWANEFVPQYKEKSGLVLYMNVSSIEQGKYIWQCWYEAHKQSV